LRRWPTPLWWDRMADFYFGFSDVASDLFLILYDSWA
jgi:hypothetical protein